MRVFARMHLRLPALFVLVLALLLVSLPAKAASNPNPGILPPNANAFGTSYSQLAADWWNWALAGPDGSNVLQDTTGALCGLNQTGKVWFLGGALNSGTVERTCTVPLGKAIFFPVANYFNSAEKPDYTSTLQKARDYWQANLESASATIDGREVADLSSYYVESPDFLLVLPQNNILDVPAGSAPAGSYSPSAAVGYHLLLAPLSRGQHELHFDAVFKNSGRIDVIYHLIVGN
jgi:hypothetical protein